MDLKLQLLANNDEKTWTLKSKRGNYSIGTTPGCDIELAGISVDVNLKFSFDEYGQIWYISDLGKRGNLLIDGQPLSDYAIQAQSKITVERGVILNLIPDGQVAAGNGHSSRGNTTTATYETSAPPVNHTYQQAPGNQRRASSQGNGKSELRKYTWPQYVKRQVAEQGSNIGMRLTLNFALNTGFRNTPWIKAYAQDGFDGYIIPDFQGSAEIVVAEIERKLGTIRQYEDTDCFVSELTDAHLIDSTTQKFLGIEFFPLRRDKITRKSDYRRFCVTAYHRVRTYLLVEKYGSDLFVSWVTRFEPIETPAVIMLWLALAFIISFAGAVGAINNRDGASTTIIALALPLILWSVIFLLTPAIMSSCSILPKKANARLVIFILIIGAYMTVGAALLTIFVTSFIQQSQLS